MLIESFISDFCMKSEASNNCTNDKKKSVLDTIPPVLLERFTLYDDNKNNNRDQRSKEYHQSIKSATHENDSNITKSTVTHGNSKNIEINFIFTQFNAR